MSLITRMLKMTAVYWSTQSIESGGLAHDDYGQPLWSSPIEIKCRWEETTEEFISSNGTRQVSSVKVYVDRDMKEGEILMLGALIDVVDENNPRSNQGAYEIKRFEKTPNLKITEYLRVVYI